jgi:hypothetical protein
MLVNLIGSLIARRIALWNVFATSFAYARFRSEHSCAPFCDEIISKVHLSRHHFTISTIYSRTQLWLDSTNCYVRIIMYTGVRFGMISERNDLSYAIEKALNHASTRHTSNTAIAAFHFQASWNLAEFLPVNNWVQSNRY